MKLLGLLVLTAKLAALPVLLSKIFLLVSAGNLWAAFGLSYLAVLIWGLSLMTWKAL